MFTIDKIADILRDHGKPMHVREIGERLGLTPSQTNIVMHPGIMVYSRLEKKPKIVEERKDYFTAPEFQSKHSIEAHRFSKKVAEELAARRGTLGFKVSECDFNPIPTNFDQAGPYQVLFRVCGIVIPVGISALEAADLIVAKLTALPAATPERAG